ncbi:MAG: hypothetical protein N2036_07230 [Bryobacteraceae bacterium]|nr:hypothetical protein [Bryobacteraceae bacterium]
MRFLLTHFRLRPIDALPVLAAVLILLGVTLYALTLPHLCHLKDDGVYLSTAASIANGNGYRVAHLPGAPWNVKYPPLYPLLLSAAFLPGGSLSLHFALANLLNWLALPLYLLMILEVCRRQGTPAPAVVALACLSFEGTVYAAHSLLSDLWSAAVILGVLLVFERSPVRAGFLASAAFLIRTATAPLLLAVFLEYLLRRRWRHAAVFAGIVLVPAAVWAAWSSAHSGPIRDYNDVFMSTYGQVIRNEFMRKDIPEHLGLQFLRSLAVLGKALVPGWVGGGDFNFVRFAASAVCLLFVRGLPRVQVLFLLLSFCQIIVWPWNPFNRLFLPLLPLLAAGAAAGIARWSRRRRLFCPSWVLGCLFTAALIRTEMHQLWIVRDYYQRNAQLAPAYDWIRKNVAPEETVSAFRDAALYFQTGRQSESLHCSVRDEWERPGSTLQRTLALAEWSEKRGHRFVLLAPDDYSLKPPQWLQLRANLEQRAKAVFEANGVLIFDLHARSSRQAPNSEIAEALQPPLSALRHGGAAPLRFARAPLPEAASDTDPRNSR